MRGIKAVIALLFLLMSCVVMAQVQVDDLDPIGLDALGLFPREVTLWSNADVGQVERLLNAVQNQVLSPMHRRLIIDMLSADTTGAYINAPEGSFFQTRLDALMALGAWEEVCDLIELVPEGHRTDSMRKTLFYASLFVGQLEVAETTLARIPAGSFVDMSRFSLMIANGSARPHSALAYQAWREGSDKENDLLFTALGDIVFREKSFEKLPDQPWENHHLMLLGLLGDDMPPVNPADDCAVRLFSGMDTVPADIRFYLRELDAGIAQVDSTPTLLPGRTQAIRDLLDQSREGEAYLLAITTYDDTPGDFYIIEEDRLILKTSEQNDEQIH